MTIEDAVNGLFVRLAAGDLAERDSPVEDGWTMVLPSGRAVARSILQTEARAIIALGPDAVPILLHCVMNDNLALRYVAIYALEQITGEKPYLRYFDHTDHEADLTRAIEVWRRWCEARDMSTGSSLRRNISIRE